MKPIRLSGHARERIELRGTSLDEVVETIRNTRWRPAAADRWECRRDFSFGREWNGKMYTTKQVRPIFVDEPNGILVVTVYVYYF